MSVLIALVGFSLLYLVGYRLYSRHLARRVFCLDESEGTPAHDPKLRDGFDYVPTPRAILWGHHYTSIAGAAPIIGPAVAVIWGWVPALLWVTLGTIFIGAVHDFGALVLSARRGGHTMADLAAEVINARVRLLFQVIVYFLIWIVLAVFAFAVGVLLEQYPASVLPVVVQTLLALLIGLLFHRKQGGLLLPSLISLVLLYAAIGGGIQLPITLHAPVRLGNTTVLPTLLADTDPVVAWSIVLLIYAAIASALPVWLLLQPRDYINSHQLVVGLILLVAGLMALHPPMAAPALDLRPAGAPPLLPVIFVTIACGAVSGFHGLVSSGTSSKQLDRMGDARSVGYGGMLGEAALAIIATLAVAAGLPDWHSHYSSWNASGIHAIANFVAGASAFLQALWIPERWAEALVAVLAISFAATSMDTGARIQRHIVSEVGSTLGVAWLKNRYAATLLAVGPAVPLVLAGPSVWAPLWLLFGTTNQLIGGLSLLVLFIYLLRARRPVLHYAIPMAFLAVMTTSAMVYNLVAWTRNLGRDGAQANAITIGLGAAILMLELWVLIEAVLLIRRLRHNTHPAVDAEAVG